MRLALASLLPLAAAQAQVYLYPPPPAAASHAAPTLTSEQAQVVMAHHLGADVSAQDAPHDVGIWGHLLHMWDSEERPRVVIVEGAESQDVLPSDFTPAFYLTEDAGSVLEPFYESAEEALSWVSHLPLVKNLLDTLNLSADSLKQELATLVGLADRLWTSAKGEWDAVCVRLGATERGSEAWATATSGLKAGIQSMTRPESPPLVLVVMPANSIHKRQLIKVSPVDTVVDVAANRTKGPKNGTHTDARPDWSADFTLLAGTSIGLVLVIAFSAMMLFQVGETKLPSTLTLSVGGGHKRD